MRREGFSLIEALVALAIASVCLLALFGLQRQLAFGQRRAEAAIARAETRRNILALIRALNPTAQAAGTTALPDGERLAWTSRPVGPLRRALDVSGGASPFVVQLYAVSASLSDGAGVVRDTVTVERMGWRRAPPETRAGPSTP